MTGSTHDGLRFLSTAAIVHCDHIDDYGWCTKSKAWCWQFPQCKSKQWVRGDTVVKEGSKPLLRGRQMFGTPQY